jgi:hypothetical protein
MSIVEEVQMKVRATTSSPAWRSTVSEEMVCRKRYGTTDSLVAGVVVPKVAGHKRVRRLGVSSGPGNSFSQTFTA